MTVAGASSGSRVFLRSGAKFLTWFLIVKKNGDFFFEFYIIAHAFDFVSFAGGAVGAAGVAEGFFCDSFFALAAS